MKSIQEILQEKVKKKVSPSERAEIMGEIYGLYISEAERINRKRKNWGRYLEWCKVHGVSKSKLRDPVNLKSFMRSREFIKELEIKVICYKLSHIKTKDLYYIKSLAQDALNRGKSCGAFILGAIRL